MYSQADDVQFLKDLSTYIVSTYGNIGKILCGHSQGGMMVSRMWYEAPSYYTAFCSAAAGASRYYYDNPALPSTIKPFCQIIGQLDTVLNVQDGPNGAGDHWTDDLWKQGESTQSIADVYIPLEYIGAWKALQVQCDAFTTRYGFPAVVIADGDAEVSNVAIGTQKKWVYQNDHLSVIWLSDGAHSIPSLQNAMHQFLLSTWLFFVMESSF